MRAAIVIAPYHTNGGYPPLGVAYLNAVLRQQGCDVSVFDLQFLLASENPDLRLTLKEFHNIGRNLNLIQPVLDLRFVLYCLYAERYPEFEWEVTNDLVATDAIPEDERRSLRDTYQALAVRLREQAQAHAALIAATAPDIVLCSSYVSNLLCSLLLAHALKRLRPATQLLLGGPGVALAEVQRFILDARLADGIAVGDGEPVVEEIVQRWRTGGQVDLNVQGVAVDARRIGLTRPTRPDLDRLPMPCFDGFPAPGRNLADYQRCWSNEYRSKRFSTFMLPIQTSRGCVLRCAFCSESAIWDGFNSRQPRSIVEELRHQQTRYGTRIFSFNASLINHDDAWHQELLERLTLADLDITWWSYYRPTNDITPETAGVMYRAGCRMVSLGVESFYQGALDAMQKGTRAMDALKVVLALARSGIFVDFALLTGFPLDAPGTLDCEYAANVQFVRALKQRLPPDCDLDVNVGHVVRLEPYSRLHTQPERFGIEKGPDQVRIPVELADLAPALSRIGGSWTARESLADKHAYAAALVEAVAEIVGKKPAQSRPACGGSFEGET